MTALDKTNLLKSRAPKWNSPSLPASIHVKERKKQLRQNCAMQSPALAMMMSLYVTLGVFLIMAARNPSANRSLIAFTAWSSFAHAAVMWFQAFRNLISRGELIGSAVLVVIGLALIVLAPARQPVERDSAVGA
jgi:hypothetical protein